MTLKEYKAKKMQDPEFTKAYEEIQPEMEAIRGAKSPFRKQKSLLRNITDEVPILYIHRRSRRAYILGREESFLKRMCRTG